MALDDLILEGRLDGDRTQELMTLVNTKKFTTLAQGIPNWLYILVEFKPFKLVDGSMMYHAKFRPAKLDPTYHIFNDPTASVK